MMLWCFSLILRGSQQEYFEVADLYSAYLAYLSSTGQMVFYRGGGNTSVSIFLVLIQLWP